ncbi:Uncharacterised protein [Enterobacter hormaechei]|nr:Uncharacterised protein [Enterobacter hormaechei]
MVLRHDNFGLITPAYNCLVDVFRPWQRFTNFRTAQGVGVVQGMGDIFRRLDQLFLFDIPEHLRRRFGARREHKIIGQAIDHLFLTIFLDDIGRGNQGHRPGGGGGAEPRTHLAFRIRLQQVAVHIAGAAAHDVARHDIFRDGGLHKSGWRVDFNLAGLHVGFVHHAAHAAIVVNVAVGVNNSDDRFLAAIFIVKIHPDFGRLRRHQRVDHGNAFFTFNNGHV